MATTITRTAWTDDDGTGTTGTVINNAAKTQLYDQIDAALATAGGAGLKELWLPARDWVRSSTAPPSVLTVRAAGAEREYEYLAFDPTSGEVVSWLWATPKAWNLGTITYRAYWSGIAGGAGDVRWYLEAVAMSDLDTINAAGGTAVQVTDSYVAVDALHISPESTAVTIAGTPAAGDVVRFRFQRNPGDAADTLNVDAALIGVKLFYTTTKGSDD